MSHGEFTGAAARPGASAAGAAQTEPGLPALRRSGSSPHVIQQGRDGSLTPIPSSAFRQRLRSDGVAWARANETSSTKNAIAKGDRWIEYPHAEMRIRYPTPHAKGYKKIGKPCPAKHHGKLRGVPGMRF